MKTTISISLFTKFHMSLKQDELGKNREILMLDKCASDLLFEGEEILNDVCF